MSELPFDPQDLGAMLQRIGAMLSAPDEGPVAWSVVQDTARERLADLDDPAIDADTAAAFADAARLATLWLDEATALPDDGATLALWTREQWVTRTLPHWRPLVEPLAARASDAFGQSLPGGMEGLPPEMAAMMSGPMGQMARRMGAAMFGMQLGQGVAELARSVLGTADLAVPLGAEAALVPAAVARFGDGLGVPEADVRLHLALRTLAHHRLITRAPWLAGRFASAVDDYARGLGVNASAIAEQLGGLDPTDPAAMQNALTSGVFEPPTTPEQEAAQRRLGALIALVEGWLDDVVDQAGALMPSSSALAEAVRRRRAAGGPAEQAFASLVGLELRPRRQRDAAALWAQLREQRGIEGRDALWNHPDLLPTDADLDDPAVFLAVGDIDWDAFAVSATEDDAQAQQPSTEPGDGTDDASGDGTSDAR
jgi:putative hydrolase